MKTPCAEMKNRIPLALLGELNPAEQIELETHLLNCSVCTAENASCAETYVQLRTISDVSTPRHFLVYPGEGRRSLKDFFCVLEPGWKLLFGGGLVGVFLLLALFLTRFQFRVENGVYSLSFGQPVPALSTFSKAREDEMKSQWMELLDARTRQDRQEFNTLVKQELVNNSRGLSAQQKKEWQAALSQLEGRLTKQIDGTAAALHTGMRQSVFELYQTVQSQRLQDINRTRKQLDRLAYQEDQKDQETKEILATLLQVTDLKLK
jgi:hypothetical protein